jgi:hypothetical protein
MDSVLRVREVLLQGTPYWHERMDVLSRPSFHRAMIRQAAQLGTNGLLPMH